MYTEEQVNKDREFVNNLHENLCSRVKDMWVVCCVWRSPISHLLEHREGCFTDYTEARLFHYIFGKELYNESKKATYCSMYSTYFYCNSLDSCYA